MAEQGTTGIFNATGPDYKLTIRKMLEDIKTGIVEREIHWVSADFLATKKFKGRICLCGRPVRRIWASRKSKESAQQS
jgi:hypothetical protein